MQAATHGRGRCATCRRVLVQGALYCGSCGRRTRLRRDSPAGSVLGGRYRIAAKLAEGGFGSIYSATHLPSGLAVALKLLHADLVADREAVARFRRESKALANLRHRHTVVPYERGELRDGTPFIAMELLDGETLADRLERGPLPWRDALATLRAVCGALVEAHARGIVHRDLKPANVHLGRSGQIKVLDFGVAKLLPGSCLGDGDDEVTFVGEAIGTLEYMAPEQLLGTGCTGRTDLYALGVLGFEMVCGRRPFPEAHDPSTLLTAILTELPPVPSMLAAVPEGVDRLLLRCLERDPAHRFEDAAALAAAIDRALEPAVPQRRARLQPIALAPLEPPARPLRGVGLYLLGAAIGAVGAAISWLALS